VGEAAATARSRVTELRERAGAAVSDATASARNTAAESLAAARETYQAGVQAVSGTGEQLSETLSQSKETLTEMMEDHPFVVGGIGLLIGAVIASALPVSQAENRILGDSSDALKNRVRDVASEGANIAAATVQSVYQDSASRVQEQGLSSDSVREIVKNVGDKVKEAAHQAADAMTKGNDPSPVRSTASTGERHE
jgi:vacuolar-type H+-ATPase subunit H